MSGSPGSTMTDPRPEKVAVVEEVRSRLSSSSAAILTEYRGLKVDELAQLRRAVRDAGGEYRIFKNTLVRIAVADLELSDLDTMLTGPTAIAFVDGDAVTVAKALRDFAKTHPALTVKGGLLGRSVLGAADAGALADVAPREVLLAQFAGGLAAPLRQMAGLLAALPRNLAYGLKALIDKQGGAPEEAAPAGEAPAATDATDAAPTEAEAETAPAEPEPAEAEPEPAEPEPDAGTTEPTEPGAADAGTTEPGAADAGTTTDGTNDQPTA